MTKLVLTKTSLCALLFSLFVSGIFAQGVPIKGKIVDASTQEPLIGATVIIEGTSLGAATDLDGLFEIANVSPGTYSLTASYVSYESQTQTGVKVEPGKDLNLTFELSSQDIQLNAVEVVAKANRESENILLIEQRKALVATQSVGAKELSRKGIGDAQAAVAQVSGISKQEGVKNVFVRGLGDRYNMTLYNGFPMPSEDPEYKNMSLEYFSTDIIQQIGVGKAFSAQHYADAAGARIDISSKELLSSYLLALNLSAGANSSTIGTPFLVQDGASYLGFSTNNYPQDETYSFANKLDPRQVSLPLKHSFGLSLGKTWRLGQNNNPLSVMFIASHDKNYRYLHEVIRNTTTDGTIWQDQTGERFMLNTSQIVLGNVSYDINNKHQLAYNSLFVHANGQYVGDYVGFHAEQFQGSPTYNGFMRRQQQNDNTLWVNQLSTKWSLTKSLVVNAGVALNSILGLEPDRREIFASQKSDGLYNLSRSNRNKRFFSTLRNQDLNAKLSATYKLADRFQSGNSEIVVGYNGRWVSDKFTALEFNFSPLSVPDFQLDDVSFETLFRDGIAQDNILMSEGDENTYQVSKNSHSAYVESSYQLLKPLSVNAGVRVDYVDMRVAHHVQHVSPGEESINKLYWLPSFNVKYDIHPDHALRLAFSKSYTLPQSKEISPYQYVSMSFASQGNPNIKPSDNYNLDLKWDYYISPSELLSVSTFYKHILNPIGRVDQGNSAGLLTYDNISPKANVMGVEVELRKNLFNFAPEASDLVNKLSAGFNASYIFSALQLDILNTEERTSMLEGASPWLVNSDLTYSYIKNNQSLMATLTMAYFSNRIHTIGAKGFHDIMEKGVPTMNLTVSYELNKHLSFSLKGANLLNAQHTLVRKSAQSNQDVVLSQYRKGMDLSVGVGYKF